MKKLILQKTLEYCEAQLKYSLYSHYDVSYFYKEWLQDYNFENQNKNYDDLFIFWFSKRIKEIYYINKSIFNKIKQKHGIELAYLFSEKKWMQEVALAQKMRLSDNKKIVILANLFLKQIEYDLENVISSIIEIYCNEGVKDNLYMSSNINLMSYHEILTSKHWDTFKPLWLRYASKEFKDFLAKADYNEKEKIYQESRDLAFKEITYRKIERFIDTIENNKILYLSSIVKFASKNKISSDQLYYLKGNFYQDIRLHKILVFNIKKSYWQIFLDYMKNQIKNIEPINVGQKEIDTRKNKIKELSIHWLQNSPEYIKNTGEIKNEIFKKWIEDICYKNTRVPSEDLLLDFMLYFFELKQLNNLTAKK